MKTRDPDDPRGLIREAYAIDGIDAAECRSIFLDWAMTDTTPDGAVERLLARYGAGTPGHPMTAVLSAALSDPPPPGRRGGARGRRLTE